MLTETQVKARLEWVDAALRPVYNAVFISGYKQALEDVLEIQRPKAKPADSEVRD